MDKAPVKDWILKSNRMDKRPQLPPVHTTEPLTVRSVLQLYFNTFLGANFAESWVYPLDVAKTRMQVEGEEAKKTGAKVPNAVATLKSIVKNEGPKTLYAGFSAMVARNLIFNSMRVVLYDVFRRKFIRLDENGKESLSISSALSCGFVAGCIAQVMANPFDIVKVRMQTEGRRRMLGYEPRVSNMFNAFTGIYREGGLPRMWKGITPSCLRACLMTAGDVGSYDLSKRFFKDLLDLDDGLRLRFLSSMCAGFTASVLSNPADVIKSRVMNQQTDAAGKNLTYKNSLDCLVKTVSEEGPMALYKGLLPCWFRLGPFSVLFWMSVEFLRDIEGQAGF